jgi:hypothetical protein
MVIGASREAQAVRLKPYYGIVDVILLFEQAVINIHKAHHTIKFVNSQP